MKILHTADWHLGQTFYQYDRTIEHQAFLEWLLQLIEIEQIDVLLISGDVFDTANPSVQSNRLWYHFLNQLLVICPDIQVVVVAGNHDSPIRLEMPQPLLERSNIHLIGQVPKNEDKSIDYQSLIIPLYNKERQPVAYCLAVPFLRLGDFSKDELGIPSYNTGITSFYKEITQKAIELYGKNRVLIAMGHLHAKGIEMNEDDTAERIIIGGVESIKASDFPDELQYVALGHIHKAQKLAQKNHIRYAGSPIPLSFSEIHYKHQVLIFEIKNHKVQPVQSVAIPIHTPLISVPHKFEPLQQVLAQLQNLPDFDSTANNVPYLEIKVLLDQPMPDLKNLIYKTIADKNVRLARIDVKYANSQVLSEEKNNKIELTNLTPLDLLQKIYKDRYNQDLPDLYSQLLNQVIYQIEEE